MFYFEDMGTLLYLLPEKCTQRFPWAASKRLPHPTNGTPTLIHLLVITIQYYLHVSHYRLQLKCIKWTILLLSLLTLNWAWHSSRPVCLSFSVSYLSCFWKENTYLDTKKFVWWPSLAALMEESKSPWHCLAGYLSLWRNNTQKNSGMYYLIITWWILIF